MANETTTKFKVDISDLKKNIQEAQRQIRLANAEFKASSAGLDNWAKSADGVSAKIAQVEKVLKAQKTILADYEKQLALIVKEYGENSKEADEMRIKIENQRAAVAKSEKALGDYQKQLAEIEAEQKASAEAAEKENTALSKLKKTIEEQEAALKDLKEKYSNIILEQGKDSDAAKELAKQIDDLSGDLKENKSSLSEVSEAADDVDNSFEETSKGGISAFGVALGNLVANVISAAVSKLKELVVETINAGKQFDSSMSQVAAVSGATGDELEMLREKAKEMGSTTQFTASEAADAFNYMAMAGWKSEQMVEGISGVLNLAAASGTDLATTSDIVTDALTAMGYAAEDAGRLADVMAAASSNANTNVEMMGETFKYAAPVTGALGYSMEDTAVAVGLMANAGIKASSAGTALRGTLSRLAKPTDEMTSVMAELGLITTETVKEIDSDKLAKAQSKVASKTATMEKAQINYNAAVKKYGESSDQAKKAAISLENAERGLAEANKELAKVQEGKLVTQYKNMSMLENEQGEMLSLMEVMQLLRDKMSGLSEAEQAQAAASLFGQEAMSGMLAIINASEEDFNKLTTAVNESEGAAEKMANTMMDNLGGDLTKLGSQFEGVQLAIYEELEPALRKGAEILSGLLDGVKWLVDHGNEVAGVITTIAAAVAGYLAYTTAVKVMTEGWAALTIVTKAQAAAQAVLNAVMSANPIGLVVAAISALVAAFVYLWNTSEDFRKFWQDLWESIQEVAGDVVEAVAGFFSGLWDGIKNVWSAVSGFFSGIWDSIQESAGNLVEKVAGFFEGAWNAIKSVWNAVVGFFEFIWESIKTAFNAGIEFIKKVFEPVVNFYKSAFNIIKELAVGCWNAIQKVWEIVSTWFDENVIQPVKAFFTGLWDGIKNAAQAAWDGIRAAWDAVSNWFSESVIEPVESFFTGLLDGIKNTAQSAWDGVKKVWEIVSSWFKNTVVKPVEDFFTGMWDGLKNGAQAAWEGITGVFTHVVDWFKDKFSRAWQAVKDVFSTGGKIFDGIKEGIVDAFKTVVNAIIRGINKVIALPFDGINAVLDKIKNVSIVGYKPFENLISRLPVPQIPELEKGGVLKRGQVGFLEGNGAEAVVPLENNAKWIRATANDLKKALASEGLVGSAAASSTVNNTYNFNQTNNSPKALSRLDIYRQSKNLFAMQGV